MPRRRSRHRSRLGAGLLVGLLCSFAGCAGGSGPGNGLAPYGWLFFNDTGAEINAVHLTYRVGAQGRYVGVGVLPAHGMATWLYATDSMPEAGVIHWIAPGSAPRLQPVGVATSIPDPTGFGGYVCFKFTGVRWEVIPLTRFDDDQILQGREVKGVKLGTR